MKQKLKTWIDKYFDFTDWKKFTAQSFIMVCFMFLIIVAVPDKPKAQIAQCPDVSRALEREVVEVMSGWKCTPNGTTQKYDYDLLTPMGVWGNKQFDCWKLIQPIEEYCKENPNHCK